MRRRALVACLVALSTLLLGNGPWPARRRPMPRPNRIALTRIAPTDWPAEPSSPSRVDEARFASALRTLCGGGPLERAQRYGGMILREARAFEVDPFLMGALVYREGRCRSDAQGGVENDRGSGVGLTLIEPAMYWENLRRGALRYRVREGERWVERTRPVDRFPFNGPRVASADANLYFTAALLRMWEEQHAHVDEAFPNEPHRHFVAHWHWGDRVRSHLQEDAILTDRRRLLEHYGAHAGPPPIRWGGLELGCPLDGCPRVITSWIGSERESGGRHHRGVDLDSLPGERVRAIADGLVVFAGVDLPGGGEHQQLRGQAAFEAIPRDRLAAGGRYVCVRHGREGAPSVRSCYMHLEEVHVAYGDRVTRGQQLGTVGRTGMQSSAAHLHLEMSTERLEDPSVIMQGLLLGRREADPAPPRRRRH